MGDALPEHDWILSVLIPVTATEIRKLAEGQRLVFSKLDPRDRSQVRGSAVYCAVCQRPWEELTPEDRTGCRGADE